MAIFVSNIGYFCFKVQFNCLQGVGEVAFSTEIRFHILRRLRPSKALALKLTAYKIDP